MSLFPLMFALGAALSPLNSPLQHDNLQNGNGAVIEKTASGGAAAIVSRYRQQNGLGPVADDAQLRQAAQFQADAMARADTLSHDVAGSPYSRLSSQGVRFRSYAENVSVGAASAEAVIGRWQRSPGHNQNLLKGDVRRVGIAVARSRSGRTYWAMVLTD